MSTHIWRNHNSFISTGYMWVVLNQANILKRHTGQENTIYRGYTVPWVTVDQAVVGSTPIRHLFWLLVSSTSYFGIYDVDFVKH